MKSRKRGKARIIAAICCIVLACLTVFGYFAYNVYSEKMGLINFKGLDDSEIMKNEISDETKAILSGYTTIALFGLDNRDIGNYSRGNSDVIMLMAIDNDTKDIKVVSVYRDTYLNIQGESGTFHKANAAYAYGGAEQAISMLNTNLDLDIDNYISFDFKTVADAIDALGGVDIKIESEEELGWLNKYIDHTNGILGTDAPHVDSVGKHTLSGVQAVAYGRIRYTSGSDFKRAERHRLVLSQLFKKAKSAKWKELSNMMDIVLPQVETNLTEKQVREIVSVLLDYSMKDTVGFPYTKCSINLHGSTGYVDVPCDLDSNVIRLHKFLYGQEDYQPSETVQEYNDTITNYTGLTADSAETDEYENEDNFDGEGGISQETDSSSSTSE